MISILHLLRRSGQGSAESGIAVNRLSPRNTAATATGPKLRFDNPCGLDIICVRMNFDRPAPGGIA
jgi:hypothetical protein